MKHMEAFDVHAWSRHCGTRAPLCMPPHCFYTAYVMMGMLSTELHLLLDSQQPY